MPRCEGFVSCGDLLETGRVPLLPGQIFFTSLICFYRAPIGPTQDFISRRSNPYPQNNLVRLLREDEKQGNIGKKREI